MTTTATTTELNESLLNNVMFGDNTEDEDNIFAMNSSSFFEAFEDVRMFSPICKPIEQPEPFQTALPLAHQKHQTNKSSKLRPPRKRRLHIPSDEQLQKQQQQEQQHRTTCTSPQQPQPQQQPEVDEIMSPPPPLPQAPPSLSIIQRLLDEREKRFWKNFTLREATLYYHLHNFEIHLSE